MATPIVTALGRIQKARRTFTARVDSLNRTQYRINGRQVSKQTYLRERRRIPAGLENAGKFMSRADQVSRLTKPGIAQMLMETIGAPVGGGDWVSRVRKSTEKFTEMLGATNQLG